MRKILVIAACLSAILFIAGCIATPSISMADAYAQVSQIMKGQFEACINAKMTKSELVMQVGLPTGKEVFNDAEIWIYQLNEQGATVSQTTYTPGDLFNNPTSTTTTDTPRYRASITIKFNKNGEMTDYSWSGQQGALWGGNNRFYNLKPPKR